MPRAPPAPLPAPPADRHPMLVGPFAYPAPLPPADLTALKTAADNVDAAVAAESACLATMIKALDDEDIAAVSRLANEHPRLRAATRAATIAFKESTAPLLAAGKLTKTSYFRADETIARVDEARKELAELRNAEWMRATPFHMSDENTDKFMTVSRKAMAALESTIEIITEFTTSGNPDISTVATMTQAVAALKTERNALTEAIVERTKSLFTEA